MEAIFCGSHPCRSASGDEGWGCSRRSRITVQEEFAREGEATYGKSAANKETFSLAKEDYRKAESAGYLASTNQTVSSS